MSDTEKMTIIEAAVTRADCLDCDWRYYALSEVRAASWADAHTEDEGHSVKVAALEGAEDD